MIELGQLDARHADFARRNTRILAASVDGPEDAARTQQRFPNVTIISDPDQNLLRAAGMLGRQKAPDGKPVADPSTVLIDRGGVVQTILRTDRYITRPAPDDVLAKIDQFMSNTSPKR